MRSFNGARLLLLASLTLGVDASAACAQCQYEVTTLVDVPGCSLGPQGSNEVGFFTGFFRCGFSSAQAFAWLGGFLGLPTPPNTTESRAIDINDNRTVVGCISISDDGLGDLAFVFDSEGTRTLGVLPDHNWSEAKAVNNQGTIVGFSMNVNTGPVSATAWIDDEIVDLSPLLLDMPYGLAEDVNERSQVVGWRGIDGFSPQHAFLLDLETEEIVDIGFMPGGIDGQSQAVNNRGQVVGSGFQLKAGDGRSFLWSAGTKTDLGIVPGKTRTSVRDISQQGLIVGQCSVGGNQGIAFLWQGGVMHDLNDLIETEELALTSASAINDNGQILCSAKTLPEEHIVAVLLSPISPPMGDATGDCVVDLRDLLLVLTEWGTCEFCVADLNDDGMVGMAELLLILSNWS